MDKALYIAMTGAKHNMLAQTASANNLANLNTTAFKSEFNQARALGVYYGDGHASRAYAITENQGTNFQHGAMIQTGRELDIAVDGDGFIGVQTPDGGEALTRAGSLHVDAFGVLLNGSNLPVLGNGGPIAVPPFEKIDIGIDGAVTIVPVGANADETVLVDRIFLAKPQTDAIRKSEDGLFRLKNPEAELEADATVRVVSGFLEGSNVNAVDELVSVLNLSRQYEMQVKLMQTVKQNSEASARMLQIS
ncbi:flagellar basal body rod protein FlgF [Agaribacterium haliotis]|uniref:flagellar basal body rod protein FlgF n=1 Tax=Agaribacterium haliotis TaxID=2013869 RepID=UPI000BB574F4|nr:flagellar basal body rod protein FlgF [Agaribacterium haliotis]